MTRVLYTKPSVTKREIDYAIDAVTNGWGHRCYEYIALFEQKFAEYVGGGYAIATSSCTGALHMGLAALEVGPGDEVVLADSNWIASAAPITYLGAKPVLVDVLKDTWCIDPEKAEAAVTPRTKAIVAVHLYGNLCDMDRLLDIGKRWNIPVIEDAAEAIGSKWRNCHAGTMGLFGTFSFHGSKTLTTGEGGMFVTRDEELYRKVSTLANHGREAGEQRHFWPKAFGFKYKLSNVQAAIGCGQLERIGELVGRKREIFQYYKARFRGGSEIEMNPEPPESVNGFWMPTVVFAADTGVTRELLMQEFRSANIDARPFFYPLSSLPMFEGSSSASGNWNSYSIAARAINLPSYHDISDEELDRVVGVIREML